MVQTINKLWLCEDERNGSGFAKFVFSGKDRRWLSILFGF